MHINPRRKKSLRKTIIIWICLLAVLGCAIFLFDSFSLFKKPMFISPLGKVNNNVEAVEKILREKKIPFSQVLISSDSTYEIGIANNGLVKISSAKDIGKQISSLQRILVELTIEGKPFKSIDFRFEEPIISF